MAASSGSTGGRRDWRKREGLASALVQVGGVAVLLAGGVTYLVHRGAVDRQLETRLRAARTASVRDNPADLRQALTELDALLGLDPDVRDAQALAADVNLRLWLEHHQDGARGAMREHLGRAEALDSRSGERYGTRALLMLTEGKPEEAERYLEDLKAQGAKSPRLTLAEAQVLRVRGRLSDARQAFAQASEAAWKEPRYAVARGEELLDEGQYAQAVEALQKALVANPEHLRARLSLALARLYQGTGHDEAVKPVADVRAHEAGLPPPLQARARVVSAVLALDEGQADEAWRQTAQALTASPDEYHALLLRARLLAIKRDAGARAAFQEAVAQRRTAPMLYLEGARALQQAADGEGALALLDAYAAVFQDVRVPTAAGRTVSVLERDEHYWLERGQLLETLSRGDEALAAYDRALAVQGTSRAKAQYAKAALLLARKDYDAARPLLLEVAPENGLGTLPEAYEALGELLFVRGEYAQGCQQYLLGLQRARLQGASLEALQFKASTVEQRLAAAGQPALSGTWRSQTEALLHRAGEGSK